jgi:hypothetical protein
VVGPLAVALLKHVSAGYGVVALSLLAFSARVDGVILGALGAVFVAWVGTAVSIARFAGRWFRMWIEWRGRQWAERRGWDKDDIDELIDGTKER